MLKSVWIGFQIIKLLIIESNSATSISHTKENENRWILTGSLPHYSHVTRGFLFLNQSQVSTYIAILRINFYTDDSQ